MAMVTLPFYLEHGKALRLTPVGQGVQHGESTETWSLVVSKGTVAGPSDLAGWEVTGVPAYSERFVRKVALGGYGKLPGDASVVFSSRPLSALRKASRGEKVAVLLDPAQVEALGRLPFGDQLEVVAGSGPVPISLLCVVGGEPTGLQSGLVKALTTLHATEAGREALAAIRLERFDEPDRELLEKVRRSFEAAGNE